MATRLDRFRERKDALFASDESPLDPEQRTRFTRLAYFPENAALDLTLPLDTATAGTEVVLDTTDGDRRPFKRAGTVEFAVDGQPVRLTVLRGGRGHLFLPFRDATAGTETYEVGRYLDLQARPDGRISIDFNYAYNPYCAYGEGWSCPIPPEENRIDVPIAAGEKSFSLPD